MKARSQQLLDRSISAILAAIEIYNKPDFPYRAESFCILAINAWELLIKAKWLLSNHNRMNSLYVRLDKSSGRPRYKRTRSGSPLTHNIDYLAKKLVDAQSLHESCRKNLEALVELRDVAVHLYHQNPRLSECVQEIGMACLKNFVSVAQVWFSRDLSSFNFYLMPLSFMSPPTVLEAVSLSKDESSFLKYLNQLCAEDLDIDSRYSIAVKISIHFSRSKQVAVPSVRVTNDPSAVEVRLSEEQIRERFPWDYPELNRRCKERYRDFKINDSYHSIRKRIESAGDLTHERRLDPKKPNPKRIFYSQRVLNELDKYYAQK